MVNFQKIPAELYKKPTGRRRLKRSLNIPGVKTKKDFKDLLDRLDINLRDLPRGNAIPQLNLLSDLIKSRLDKDNIDDLINRGKFQTIINKVIKGKITLNDRQANQVWNNIQGLGRFTLELRKKERRGKQIVTLNQSAKNYFLNALRFGPDLVSVTTSGGPIESDVLVEYEFSTLRSMRLRKLEPSEMKIKKNKDGAFFPYINTTKVNLLQYQIFTEIDTTDITIKDEKKEHCLLYALYNCGVSKTLLNNIRLAYFSQSDETFNRQSIRKTDLKQIAKMIKRDILLHQYHGQEKSSDVKKTIYKCGEEKSEDPAEIAIYEGHFFKYEQTIYSKYSINNYEDVKDLKDFHNITKKRTNSYDRTPLKYKINSLLLVHKLFKNGYFKKLDMSKFPESQEHQETKDHIYLENMEFEQKEFIHEEKKNKKDFKIFYSDCESYVHKNPHSLYLLGVVSNEGDMVEMLNIEDPKYESNIMSKGQAMVYDFLNIITKKGKQNALVYYHNVKYDYHILEKYLNIKGKCQKDGNLYNVQVYHKGKKVEFRDSFKLLSFALKKFPTEFNLSSKYHKKEAIAYNYYKPKNNNKRCDVLEYNKLLSNDEQLIFLKQLINEPSYDQKTKTFNPLEYYKDYLRLDCLVLKKGLQKFEKLIRQITNNKSSIYESLTISSLTDLYMKRCGAYDGVYEVKGNTRQYISKAVYGGRVSVNKKYHKKVIEGKISDYDACSLYPSAIYRLCRNMGLPTGKARRLLKEDFKNWENLKYSIMTIKINKVKKIQQMPMMAHRTKDSILYLNEVPENEIIIDSITLQDYIKFQDIEYEIIDGIYWNEGYNRKIGEIIKELYNERLKHKKTNKALANTIKLMLNSAYGKTIMKKSKTEKKIIKASKSKLVNSKWVMVDDKAFDSYVYNNFNTIRSYRKLNKNCYEVECLKVDDSYNRGHIGCAILSMSKRIMNEVFDVANDNNLPIYYTDTDSIHLNLKDVEKLEQKYNKRYGKELNGKNLEQFHTDFDLEGSTSEIYSTKSIFLGKKSYIDCLESKDKDGKTITGFHIRLKGITKEGLEHSAKEYKDGYLGLYEDLAKGTEKTMVLNPYNPDKNSNKVLFEFKQGKVSTKEEFTRKVQF